MKETIIEKMNRIKESIKDKEIITSDENKNIEELFLIIKKYAEENYIYPSQDLLNTYYTFNYEEEAYNAGYTEGPESFYYCEKSQEKSLIDLTDIVNEHNKEQTDTIRLKLEILKHLLTDLSEQIPEEKMIRKVKKIYVKKMKK